jgi:septal ring factor EnvC (AmiA/AmiB activator)
VKNARSASSLALILSLCFASGFPAHAADTAQSIQLSEKLEIVRTQRLNIEKALVDAEKTKKSTEAQLKRLKSLQKLQHQEKELTEKRLAELEKYLVELTTRKDEVQKKIEAIQGRLRIKFSKLVHPLLYEQDRFLRGDEGEGERAVRDRVISSVTLLELKELESLHADLLDADEISARIEEEKQQISSLMQDISEQESLIAFHKKLREDITKDKHEEHLRQLDEYRKLKTSEVEIERMVSRFQERQKLEHDQDVKKLEPQVAFRAKSLPWPLKGKLVGTYGQHKDEKTGLNIFKKGIDILTMVDDAPVTAVMDGKIQFAGDIPGKGKVVIVEHPGSLFTIYAGLRDLTKQTGTDVKASEKLGTLETQTPLYFEIRARNVAIDPVKWLQ